jgi:hypothetical protein
MIDLGFVTTNGLSVDDYYDPEHHYDHPAFWLLCGRGHRTFATVQQIETGNVSCADCAKADADYAGLQKRIKRADEMLAAGREEEPDFLKEDNHV